MAETQNVVTFPVASDEDFKRRMKDAFAGIPQGNHISFATPELLWQTLTAKRWEILKAMTGAGALSIREVARRVGRDVKAVHGDVTALVQAGVSDARGTRGEVAVAARLVFARFLQEHDASAAFACCVGCGESCVSSADDDDVGTQDLTCGRAGTQWNS